MLQNTTVLGTGIVLGRRRPRLQLYHKVTMEGQRGSLAIPALWLLNSSCKLGEDALRFRGQGPRSAEGDQKLLYLPILNVFNRHIRYSPSIEHW
jgi:hypothetical protein